MAEIETAPSRRQTSATPSGQRRRHHSARQASDPQATSTTICVVDNGSALSCSAGLRNSAPSDGGEEHPAASTALSRPAWLTGQVRLGQVVGAPPPAPPARPTTSATRTLPSP